MSLNDVVWVTFITTCIYVVWRLCKHIYNLIRLPPGPVGLPYLGIALKLDPDKVLEILEKWKSIYGDIYSFSLPGHTVVVVSSYELIKEVLITRSDDFAGRLRSFRQDAMFKFQPNVGFTSDSPHWRMVKKTLTTALKMYGERISKLEEISLDALDDMVEEWKKKKGKPFDPQDSIHNVTGKIISSLTFGEYMTDEEFERNLGLQQLFFEIFAPRGKGQVLEMMPWLRYFNHPTWLLLQDHVRRSFALFEPLVDKCKERFDGVNPRCVVDALLLQQRKLREENNGKDVLNDLDVLNDARNLIGAGTSTTHRATQAFVAILTNHPELQSRLQREVDEAVGDEKPRLSDKHKMPLTEACVFELLRYISHVPILVPHAAMQDTTLAGYPIPKDSQVWVNAFGLHHDPRYWEEPWEFKPERFLDENGKVVAPDHPNKSRLLPFGAGRRVCVGEVLARNRLFLMMSCMVQHFTFQPLSEEERPEHRPDKYVPGFVIHPKDFEIFAHPRK